MNATLLRFAAIARGQANNDLGRLFQDQANSARCEHFAQVAEDMELCADTLKNLRCAIAQKKDAAGLYGTCAIECREDGDEREAKLFERLRTDELVAVRKLEQILFELTPQLAGEMAVN